jgi:outer membrane immunogenic protein
MKKFLVAGIAAAVLCAAPALAADMPMKAEPAPTLFNWSGFYFGGGVGWSGNDSHWAFDPPAVGGVQSFSSNKDSFAFSGHIGIQQQWGNFVLGVEASLLQPNVSDGWFGQQCSNNPNVTCQMRANDFLTVGPRIGYAQDRWLVYGTGGWATANVESRFITTATGAPIDNTTRHENGWFAGGGIERAVASNVILGVDYKHIDFGSKFHCSSLGAPCTIPSINNRDISNKDDIVLARLTFKLGPPFGPAN